MPIDQYENDFHHLVSVDLQRYIKTLESMIKDPISMDDFAIDGVGVATISRRLGLKGDFSGCYVLIEGGTPIYVGISKKVLQRLHQHVKGKTHFDASLAYRIASHQTPHQKTRSKAMEQKKFKDEFDTAKKYLRSLKAAYVEIVNPLALYVFEPFCAMHFDTNKWNTFETH